MDIMRPSLLVCFLGLIVLCRAQDSTLVKCARDTVDYRPPKNSDMNVTCGTDKMYLSILLCPIYFGGYNETLMALNSQFNTPGCQGIAELNTSSPVLKFSFGISKQGVNLCGNSLKITSEAGTGIFSQYSNVQQVNISGKINSYDPSAGTITYKQEVMYQFSCQYPLVYFVNNTELSVSGVSLAVKDNNGTFISTLSMSLYKDQGFTQPMSIPQNGLQLKTRIFVEIKATNLTDRFNVLLDRCYASTSPAPTNSTFYDLFVGCSKDIQTVVHLNGASQRAQFSFEAFRFTEHKNKTVSTFYLHCLTRLCENSTCASMMPTCNSRRRREVESVLANRKRREAESESDVAMVSSGPIFTRVDSATPTNAMVQASGSTHSTGDLTGVAITTGILCAACVGMAAIIAFLMRRRMTR
ncbi:zona pellucida-like domain-containing protein 1 [Alosa sapidissima]|uniref:zona pellucida-like domain-containing protein 1 n=1 Tax=Alosa sapidissima TaxID=34773 RepID=UPI001C09258A|nr:zona pellucida-like domain-containing protein 1 [Alosa sapidissima]